MDICLDLYIKILIIIEKADTIFWYKMMVINRFLAT